MVLDLIILDGYGYFVWPAFIFSFISCAFLYFKTKKEMQKQEKIFLNSYAKPESGKIKTTKKAISEATI